MERPDDERSGRTDDPTIEADQADPTVPGPGDSDGENVAAATPDLDEARRGEAEDGGDSTTTGGT